MKYLKSLSELKKLISFLAFTFLFVNVSGQTNTIKGKLNLKHPVESIILGYYVAGENKSDVTKLIDGKFSFSRELTEPTWAILVVSYAPADTGKRGTVERLPIYIEPGVMTINAKDSLKFAKISGSKSQKVYDKYLKQREPYETKRKNISDHLKTLDKNKDEAEIRKTNEEMAALQAEIEQKLLVDYLTNNPKSPIATYVLWYYFSRKMDLEKAEPLFEGLDSKIKLGEYGVSFKIAMDAIKNTELGSIAKDFTQNDTLGIPVSLSSFKGKYVLVDFWGSWCVPCRAENPNVVKAFHDFKDKGFTVLGVSLEQPGKFDAWMKAIHKDELTWTHVSDFKFWNNEAAKLYGVKSVPANFLIDPTGKIVAKDIRGEELHKTLGKFLK